MGTPNVDRDGLERALTQILSQPVYKQALDRENDYDAMKHRNKQLGLLAKNRSFKTSAYVPKGPKEFSQQAVKDAFGEEERPNLLEPVYVLELIPQQDSICLYRTFDGISHKTGLTLGKWWCNRRLVKQICFATSRFSGEVRERMILQFMRSAMFIHPDRNHGTEIARMTVPVGGRVPVIVGKGSWEALKRSTDPEKNTDETKILTAEDVIEKLAMVPLPGPKQFFLPLVNDMWVSRVDKRSENWPLG